MSSFLYYLLTFAESVTSVFGLRFPYEQPHYTVLQDLGHGAEVRKYEPKSAIEAVVNDPDRERAAREAFGLLFRYITGANQREQMIAMTVPVRTASERIAMTTPMQTSDADGRVSMRFFLPDAVASAGAPAPLDPRLHVIQVPASTIAALHYSGVSTPAERDHQAAMLLGALARSSWNPTGEVFQFNYDPPFTIPFLRRNEVAVSVSRGANRTADVQTSPGQ